MGRLGEFKTELHVRLDKRRHEIFGYLLNLAWILLFKEIYSLLFGDDPGLLMRIVVALSLTVLSVGVTVVRSDASAVVVDTND